MKKEIDWMGEWYKIIKERGENDEPTLFQINLNSNEKNFFHFSHSEMDGVGAFYKYYAQKGIELKRYPELQEKTVPGIFERVKIFWNVVFSGKKIKPLWIEKNDSAMPDNPHTITWFILSPEETTLLEAHCKKNKISLCAYMMTKTSQVLLAKLTHNLAGAWTLPVNLRPVLKRQDFCSNHSSGVIINIDEKTTPEQTHQAIKSALLNKVHWAVWWIHQIGKYIGVSGMRFLSEKSAKSNFVCGSFSYLGKWDLPKDHIWIGGPPGSKNFPISIMVMLASDHLSFSLKIHPYILKDQTKTEELLNLIRQNLFKDLKI